MLVVLPATLVRNSGGNKAAANLKRTVEKYEGMHQSWISEFHFIATIHIKCTS